MHSFFIQQCHFSVSARGLPLSQRTCRNEWKVGQTLTDNGGKQPTVWVESQSDPKCASRAAPPPAHKPPLCCPDRPCLTSPLHLQPEQQPCAKGGRGWTPHTCDRRSTCSFRACQRSIETRWPSSLTALSGRRSLSMWTRSRTRERGVRAPGSGWAAQPDQPVPVPLQAPQAAAAGRRPHPADDQGVQRRLPGLLSPERAAGNRQGVRGCGC